jgi:hypothetical protein
VVAQVRSVPSEEEEGSMNHPYQPQPDTPEPPRAACVGQWDLFESDEPAALKAAVAICDSCPISHCGYRRVAKAAPVPTRFYNCGTAVAAEKHRRRAEPMCDPCRDARNEANRAYRAKARARKEATDAA